MYNTASPLDSNYIEAQYPPRCYVSKKKKISASDQGRQRKELSLVESYKAHGTCKWDASADKVSFTDEADRVAHVARLPPPYSSAGIATLPVSMYNANCSSGMALINNTYIFDHEDDGTIKPRSAGATSPMPSSASLQPTVDVPPETPRSGGPSSQPSSPTSMLPDDDTDLLVAKQVMFIKPRVKPSLILISPGP